MKRITQILASILFVITVLTIYLAFDFAINNAISHKNHPHKRSQHDHNHEHNHPHDDIKIVKKRLTNPPILHEIKKQNQTVKHHNEDEDRNLDHDRRARNIKQQQSQLRAKPGNFHKGKTGVKVNKPKRSIKEQQKRLSTSTRQNKDKRRLHDNQHV